MKTPFSTGNRYFLTTPPYVSKSFGSVMGNVWADRGQMLGQMLGQMRGWGLLLEKNNVAPMGINIFNIWGYFGANWGR